MTNTHRRWIALTETVLRLLLRLYPRRFRARFGHEVLASAREDLAGAADPGALVAASAREIGHALAGVIPQHQLEHARDPRPGLTEKTMLLLLTLATEIRLAARSLLKTPGFTVVALVVLALGIGASTAVFSVVDAVVLRALPFDEHDRLVAVLEHDPQRATTFGAGATTSQNYLDWRVHQQSFEALAATSGWRFRLQNEAGEPADAQARRVTPEFFQVLRVAPALGRAFVPEDETASRKVAVLSHAFWQRQFGGASDVVGRRIELNEEPWEIVGVLPRDFSYPVASPQPAEIFVPQFFAPDDRSRESGNRSYNFLAIGRLKPGVSVASAEGEMKRIAAALALEHPKWYRDRTARVIPLHAQFVGDEVRGWMLMLLGSVAFVLLIACANVANLMLARASERGRELGIRAALGAGRLTLMRGLLVESLVLSTAGTMLGVAVGAAGVRALKAWLPAGLPRTAAIGIDWRVLAAATLAAVGTGVLFGLLPALQSSRPNISQGLRDGGRSATAGVARRGTRSALVVAEVALATVLLVGAGLFIASFMNLMRVDPGFDYRGVMTPGSVGVPFDRANPQATFARGRIYTNEVIAAIARVPGVDAVAGVQGGLPLTGSWSRTPVTLPDKGELKGDDMDIDLRTVTTGYLELLRLPLRAGRYPNDQDRDGAPAVVVVNEAAARKFWDGRPVVGERVTLNKVERTIIGVVGDIRHLGPEQPVRQEAYVPALQTQVTGVTLVLRTTTDPAALLPAVKAAIWSVNPEQRLGSDPGTMDGYFDRLIAQRRFNMTLLALFGVLGLVIAAVGIYGVMGYLVSQRTTEFGVRMALGATRATLVGMVLRQAGLLLAAGLALGAGVAWWFSSAANAFLFQLDGADARVFAAALGVLAAVGLVASAVPARRAARVDPLSALRAD